MTVVPARHTQTEPARPGAPVGMPAERMSKRRADELMAMRALGGFEASDVLAQMWRQRAPGPPSFRAQQRVPLHGRVAAASAVGIACTQIRRAQDRSGRS